jgi:predicted transcriptional regulator of viral defense system
LGAGSRWQEQADALKDVQVKDEKGAKMESTTPMESIAPEFIGLQDIDEIEPISDKDRACLDEIQKVLERHGALQRFGVSLLHSHFPVHEGEILVESCNKSSRTLTLRPVKLAEVSENNLMETNWRLDLRGAVNRCVAYCHRSGGRHTGEEHNEV